MPITQEIGQTGRALAKQTLSRVKRPAASRRFVNAVDAAPAGRVHVNVGAGALPVKGWINTDVHWRAAHYLDLTRPWPCGTNRLDRIFGGHVIEHLSLDKGRHFLRHAQEALKPGGRIRLATPDARGSAEAYRGGSAQLWKTDPFSTPSTSCATPSLDMNTGLATSTTKAYSPPNCAWPGSLTLWPASLDKAKTSPLWAWNIGRLASTGQSNSSWKRQSLVNPGVSVGGDIDLPAARPGGAAD